MGKDMAPIKKEKQDDMLGCCSDGQHYSYGSSIRIEDDLIGELGIGELAVEDLVEIRAVGFIDSKSEDSHSNSNGEKYESKSMRIQFTGLKIKRKSEEEDMIKQLYKG